jgi:hypothetical protein
MNSNNIRLLFLLCFSLSAFRAFAIDEPRVISQSTLLVDKIKKNMCARARSTTRSANSCMPT